MGEGYQELAQQAELSEEQEMTLSQYFPEGKPRNEEEQLLWNRLVSELATGTINLGEVVEQFKQQRAELLAKGGFDPEDYIVEKGGIVEKGARVDADGNIIH
jgi:hypothetical protein